MKINELSFKLKELCLRIIFLVKKPRFLLNLNLLSCFCFKPIEIKRNLGWIKLCFKNKLIWGNSLEQSNYSQPIPNLSKL